MKFFRKTGVIFFSALFLAIQVSSQQYRKDSLPPPTGYVNDFEHIFSGKQQQYLDSMIKAFERTTTVQIAVVTIDTSMVSRKNFENYIFRLLNAWGVGQKGKNNGVVVGISKGYRFMRIENGYGIEATLTDGETKKIIDNDFVPLFKNGRYFEGTVQGLQAIMKKLR